jgi:cold shock CspA family protein
MTSTGTSSDEILTGRVKWFNNKGGFGFITVTNGSQLGTDVFVHHTAITVSTQQYKYLVQGEYVEFQLSYTPEGKHVYQSSNIKGINGGKLMCETRNELSKSKNEHTSQQAQNVANTTQGKRNAVSEPRVRGEGPRSEEKQTWTVINTKKSTKPTATQKKTKMKKTAEST